MKCPIDDATLVMSERSGIEIDYCPTCRGVWLDRGEIDKIIERSLGQPGPAPAAAAAPTLPPPPPSTLPPPQTRPHDSGYDRRRWGSGDSAPSAPSPEDGWRSGQGYGPGDGRQGYRQQPRRRRESWLSDLFD